MGGNVETRARAQCREDLKARGWAPHDLELAVDRYWPVVAAEIIGNVFDEATALKPFDFEDRRLEYEQIMSPHRAPPRLTPGVG